MTDTFPGLIAGHYQAIVADPPWSFLTWGKRRTVPHRSPDQPYKVMESGDLARLPVAELAARDCVLFLWTVSSHTDKAFQIAKIWGFEYKSKAFEWLKVTKSGEGFKMGMGHWTRQESETCYLFTRGSPHRLSKGVRSTIWTPVREHSRKPDEMYDRIEALVSGPYAELFARLRRRGWAAWGDELEEEL